MDIMGDNQEKTITCKDCVEDGTEIHLHAEIDHLKQHLAERDAHIVALEGEFLKGSTKNVNLEEQVSTWREKYERLYDSHKRVQKINQNLEEKLLQMVDKCKNEKSQLTKDIATLSVRLAESKHSISQLHKENERYKNDMNLAIQLLQCKPDNFVMQKLDTLPSEMQGRVSQYIASKAKFNLPLNGTQGNTNVVNEVIVDSSEYEFSMSASLMSKILEDSVQDTITKHCDTCVCDKSLNNPFSYGQTHYSISTQTLINGETKNSLCLNCNMDVKSLHSSLSNRSNSPLAVKIFNTENDLTAAASPIYLVRHGVNAKKDVEKTEKINKEINANNEKVNSDEKLRLVAAKHKDIVNRIGDNLKELNLKNNFTIEPIAHHRLCDRTKSVQGKSEDSFKSNTQTESSKVPLAVVLNDQIVQNDVSSVSKSEINVNGEDNRKDSVDTCDVLSRTSSVAKSDTSTQKSNVHIGPGPRFCSLRVQVGSKNILLDNAQPDVPPVLYTRQNKLTDVPILTNSLLQDDALLSPESVYEGNKSQTTTETTLVDVHTETENNENVLKDEMFPPIFADISCSPLIPEKAPNSTVVEHSWTEEVNVNDKVLIEETKHIECVPMDSFNNTVPTTSTHLPTITNNSNCNEQDVSNGNVEKNMVKIFNFNVYEQHNMLNNNIKKYTRKKIDLSQLNHIENTKISKDLPPIAQPEILAETIDKTTAVPFVIGTTDKTKDKKQLLNINKLELSKDKTELSKINHVNKKPILADKSTSSLSSDDSATVLQMQQLIRVAEWVQQNLEQQTNLEQEQEASNEPVHQAKENARNNNVKNSFSNTEIVHKMPHPVTKYSDSRYKDVEKQRNGEVDILDNSAILKNKISSYSSKDVAHNNMKELMNKPVNVVNNTLNNNRDKVTHLSSKGQIAQTVCRQVGKPNQTVTAEDLAQMEYNVKKFLLRGSHWTSPDGAITRSRRTSSKTETDL